MNKVEDVFSIYKNTDFSENFIESPQNLKLFDDENSYREAFDLRNTASLKNNIDLLKIIAKKYQEECRVADQVKALLEAGHLLRSSLNLGEAINVYVSALELSLEIKNDEFSVIVMLSLSHILRIQGIYGEALKYCKQAKEKIANIQENRNLLLAVCQETMADVYRSSGSWEEAESNYGQARDVYDTLDDGLIGMLNTFNSSGDIFLAQHKIEEAEDFYCAALEVSDAIQDKQGILNAKYGLAKIAITKEDYSSAFHIVNFLLENYNYIGDKLGYANSLFLKAKILNTFGHHLKAVEYLQYSKTIFEKIQCPLNVLLTEIQIYEIKNISQKGKVLENIIHTRFKNLINKNVSSEDFEYWPLEREGSIILTTDIQ